MIAEHAAGVEFDRPVYVYVDNFLGFPVGTAVPSGSYDHSDLTWAPMPDGVVVKIEDIVDGKAVLSAGKGGDVKAPDDELALLAKHFQVGSHVAMATRLPRPLCPKSETSPSGRREPSTSPRMSVSIRGRTIPVEGRSAASSRTGPSIRCIWETRSAISPSAPRTACTSR